MKNILCLTGSWIDKSHALLKSKLDCQQFSVPTCRGMSVGIVLGGKCRGDDVLGEMSGGQDTKVSRVSNFNSMDLCLFTITNESKLLCGIREFVLFIV